MEPGTPLLSPLRFPGSKRRLVPYLKEAIQLNNLSPRLFVEPFAGGASVALQLACDGIVEQIGLSDLDPLLASFWHCVFFDTEWLIQAIEGVEISLENWEFHRSSCPDNERGRALKCIFLNRTSFSGILASSAGPIGGKSQLSDYGIGCRFNKSTVIKRIRQASTLSEKVAFVHNLSWEDSLARVNKYAKEYEDEQVFLYLDPPFYFKADRLYNHYFDEEEHTVLHDVLMQLSTPWLLSYDLAEPIMELYSSDGMNSKHIEVVYSAGGSSDAKELIISNLPVLPTRQKAGQASD